MATFGTTVTSSSGLQGDVYLLPEGARRLPNFKKLKPVGRIYTTSLVIWPRAFEQGFPGVTERFEWFAIQYNGRIWVEAEGVYRFRLLSDDGTKLWIDDQLLIDNDGIHQPLAVEGSARLSRGAHRVRLGYFQGPRARVALVLSIQTPGSEWRFFDTNQFLPPGNPAEWVEGTISGVKRGVNY